MGTSRSAHGPVPYSSRGTPKASRSPRWQQAGLLARTPQHGLQPLSFLFPPVFLAPRTFLESPNLGLDGRGPVRMLALCLFQGRLRALAVAFSRRSRSLSRAASSRRRSACRRFRSFSKSAAAFRASRSLILGATRFAGFGRCLSRRARFSPVSRSDGRSECSAKRPFDPAGRLSTTPGFDIVAATTSGSSVS